MPSERREPESDPPSETETRGASPAGGVLRFTSLARGQVFAKRYEIGSLLGRGGSAEVYAARDRVADSQVALKILFPDRDSNAQDRLRRELAIVRGLAHPGILRVWDIGESEGLLYVVSERLAGETLGERLAREGPLSEQDAESILVGVLDALAVAHERGVVHRDLKPSNIFLDRSRGEERVVLLDFGLARPQKGEKLTLTGSFVGTPEYCSPEQVRAEEALTPASDVYSCGITLWEMLSGTPPFTANSQIEVLHAHLARTLPPLPPKIASTRPALRALLRSMLEKESRRRPTSAAEALQALRGPSLGARFSLLRASLRSRQSVVLTGTLALIALLALWAAEPVSVSKSDEGALLWTLRAGLAIEQDPLVGARDLVAEDARALYAKAAWIAPDWTLGDLDEEGSLIYHKRSPVSAARALAPTSAHLVDWKVYPGVEQPFVPARLYPFDLDSREGEAEVALFSYQRPSSASMLMLAGESPEPWGAPFYNPGHVEQVLPYRPTDDEELQLIGCAFNNRLGQRVAMFSLPASRLARGQAPPFEGNVQHHRDSALWYLPLEGVRAPRQVRFDLNANPPRVHLEGGDSFAFDPRSGVPLDEDARGGLTKSAWREARDTAWSALYRAGLHRLRAGGAAAEPEAELTQALSNFENAIATRAGPARYDLQEAHVRARLGDREGVASILDRILERDQHPDLALEWYLVDWMAGMPRPYSSFVGFLTENEVTLNGPWAVLVEMLEAYRLGRYEAVSDAFARLRPEAPPWRIHHYFLARAALDREEARVADARAQLELLEGAVDEGTRLPVASLRMLIESHEEPGSVPMEALVAIRDELERFEERSHVGIVDRAMLTFARRDATRLARRMGIAPTPFRGESALDLPSD